jgi:mono/diheme cytochrome c family protein
MRVFLAISLLVVGMLLTSGARTWAADEQSVISEVKAAVAEASTLYRQKKFKECGQRIAPVIEKLNSLVQSKDVNVLASIRRTHAQAMRARQLLAKQGAALPELKPLVSENQLSPSSSGGQRSKNAQSAMIEVKAAVAEAAALYMQGKYKECGAVVTRAIEQLNDLTQSGEADVIVASRDLRSRANRARQLLAKQGVKVPALNPLASRNPPQPKPTAVAASARRSRTSRDDSEPSSSAASPQRTAVGVSFVSDVAPILVRQCGSCHVRDRKGDFSMASFESLLKGGESGEITIDPGNPESSYLIELVESGDMPPRGNLTEADIRTLLDWVAAGAGRCRISKQWLPSKAVVFG